MEGGFERRKFTNDAPLSIANATRPDNESFVSEFQPASASSTTTKLQPTSTLDLARPTGRPQYQDAT